MKDETKYMEIAGEVIKKAQKAGAEHSEVYFTASEELSIDIRDQEVETMKKANEFGIGLRVIKDQKVGFAFTSEIKPESLENLVREAVANSEKTSVDEYNIIPEPSKIYPSVDVYDPDLEHVSIERKIELAKEIEQYGKNFDKRVKITETCTYEDSKYLIVIVNSKGIESSYRGTFAGAYSYFVAEENGEHQTGFGMQFSTKIRDLNPKEIGIEGAQKAVSMLGAKNIKSQKAAVVLDPYVMTNFFSIIAPALTADSVQKDKSLFKGKIGQKVASELITIVDDGRMNGGIFSAPFDGEGVATSETVLINNGILQGFLYNTYTAAKDGVESTGNGVRLSSYRGTPEVGTTNFYLKEGKYSKDKLISEVKKGLYVTEVMGMHTANPISGDFSIGVAGIWIEDGEFAYPVKGAVIAGNILEFLSSVDFVADDLRFFAGKGAPTVRVSEITISGD
ncbi:MAG: Peptidase U62 modulator of DNA gyrase [Clostridia bacterium 41_269]|nr:MAG: Peptidase U62 modulator of DNA gyrase [Clostridia bacterium 41_269]